MVFLSILLFVIIPKDSFVQLNDEDFHSTNHAIDAFLVLNDVDSVEHNMEILI